VKGSDSAPGPPPTNLDFPDVALTIVPEGTDRQYNEFDGARATAGTQITIEFVIRNGEK